MIKGKNHICCHFTLSFNTDTSSSFSPFMGTWLTWALGSVYAEWQVQNALYSENRDAGGVILNFIFC